MVDESFDLTVNPPTSILTTLIRLQEQAQLVLLQTDQKGRASKKWSYLTEMYFFRLLMLTIYSYSIFRKRVNAELGTFQVSLHGNSLPSIS